MSPTLVELRTRSFLNRCLEQFETHEERIGWHGRVAGLKVRQRHLGGSLYPLMTKALAHLEQPFDGEPDLVVHYIDMSKDGVDIGVPVWGKGDIGSAGLIAGLEGTNLRATWDFNRSMIQVIDVESGKAVVIVANAEEVPKWEYTFPLRFILHWWSTAHNEVLLHAGGVGNENGGALLLGVGGSGKSTTSLACSEAGLKLAGDDFVMVGLGESPVIHSLYSTAKLNDASTSWFPNLEGQMKFNIDADNEKNIFFGSQLGLERFTANLPLKMMFRLEKTGRSETTIVPATSGEIFKACSANTVALLPGNRAETLKRLAQLSSQVPGYTLRLGTDLAGVGACVKEAIESA